MSTRNTVDVLAPPADEDLLPKAYCDKDSIALAWRTAGSLVVEACELEARAKSKGEALTQIVQLFGQRGLLGLVVPSAYGGTFEDVRSLALCLARERLAHASPLADLAFAMQGLGSYALTAKGSDAQRERWLPQVAAGEVVSAFALTEADAGSDLSGIRTSAKLIGDEYELTGKKIFISNAGIADLYVVFAATAEPGAKRRLSAFAVPATAMGLSTRPMHVLGGHPIGEVSFDGARVPADARIGEEGEGLALALATLHRFRPTVGAAAIGFAQRALDESVRHVKSREQFGVPLASQQAVQLAIADMACETEAGRLLVYRAAAHADVSAMLTAQNGAEPPGDRERIAKSGSMAKLVATENAFRVVDRAVQLHGGRGVLSEGIIARLYEDVRSLRIYEGASDVQRLLIARALLS